MSELKVEPVAQFCADCRSVRLSASMNSRLITEYAAGVSRRSVARRPPASALAAAKPVSRSELTSNGVRWIALSDLAGVWALARVETRRSAATAIAGAEQRAAKNENAGVF